DASPQSSASAQPPPEDSQGATEQEIDAAAPGPRLRCPEGMLAVADRFCIDRWEASLVDKETGIVLSPYYPPDRKLATFIQKQWDAERLTIGNEEARQIPLPPLPSWQRSHDPVPKAVSRPGVIPNGYLSGVVAAHACENAGKRLCRHSEWVLACKGEA